MIDAGDTIRVMCNACHAYRQIDLVALAGHVGRDYSLIDRRCRCRLTEGCDGWNGFAYLLGVYRPLVTAERSTHRLLHR